MRRKDRATPPRRRPQRRREAGFARQALERGDVLGLVVQLVLDLDADHSALGTAEAGDLPRHLLVPASRELQVDGIVGARAGRCLDHPVRVAAVAHLAVAPRPDADDDVDTDTLGGLDERGDVEVSLEADLSTDGFVVDPEQVGRHRGETGRHHQSQGLLPPRTRDAAEVELARHRDHGRALDLDPPAVQTDTRVLIDLIAHGGHDQRRPRIVQSDGARAGGGG